VSAKDDDVVDVVESAVGEGPASGVSAAVVVRLLVSLVLVVVAVVVVVAKPRTPAQRWYGPPLGSHRNEDDAKDEVTAAWSLCLKDDDNDARDDKEEEKAPRRARIPSSFEKEGREGGSAMSSNKAFHEHDGPAPTILCSCCSSRHSRRWCRAGSPPSRCQLASCCRLTEAAARLTDEEEAGGLRDDDDAASASNLVVDDEDAMVVVVVLLLVVVVVVVVREPWMYRCPCWTWTMDDCNNDDRSNDWSKCEVRAVTSHGYPRHNTTTKYQVLLARGVSNSSSEAAQGFRLFPSDDLREAERRVPRFVPKMH
jgi:hypothetical protein